MNDLVEERDGPEDNSQVSRLDSRVAGGAIHWDQEVEEEGFGRAQEFRIGQTELKIAINHQARVSSSQMDTCVCTMICKWGLSA